MNGVCGLFVVLLVASVELVVCWHPERSWATIVDGKPTGRRFEPATFRKHPQQDGRLVRDAYAALYMDETTRELAFGQAEVGKDGRICGVFNFRGQETIHTCTRFRVLVNDMRESEFFLVKPEKFDEQRDEPVEYLDDQLVLHWDPEQSASYFGTLHHPKGEEAVLYAVDYNGAPVDVRGKEALSGDFVLFVVDEKK
ncbi:hypothetical protein M3Y99_00372100 [Aphelenchoides fujianensis]|nr:hypothetical protein M3Y99_00372100 [Aphelenchoides fujianensis]